MTQPPSTCKVSPSFPKPYAAPDFFAKWPAGMTVANCTGEGVRMSVQPVQSVGEVTSALRKAADATGVDFEFLLATAKRESALNPNAAAKNSSATGLFQFVEQTWLATLKNHGAAHGLASCAEDITRTASGRYEIADPARKAEILALRCDPEAASAMAAELTADNAAAIEARLGTDANEDQLYAAHFLGIGGALKLLDAAARDPSASAATLFPDAAGANPSIFYEKGGRARSVSELVGKLGVEAPAQVTAPPSAAAADDIAQFEWPVSATENSYPNITAPRFEASFVRGNTVPSAGAPLRLTPAVIEILSMLHLLPDIRARDER